MRLWAGGSAEPPDVLSILREGLKPMTRQYVHLSADIETALSVGARPRPRPAGCE